MDVACPTAFFDITTGRSCTSNFIAQEPAACGRSLFFYFLFHPNQILNCNAARAAAFLSFFNKNVVLVQRGQSFGCSAAVESFEEFPLLRPSQSITALKGMD